MNEVYPYMESSIPIWNVVSLYNVDVRTMRRIVQPRQPEASENAVQNEAERKRVCDPEHKKGLRPLLYQQHNHFEGKIEEHHFSVHILRDVTSSKG